MASLYGSSLVITFAVILCQAHGQEAVGLSLNGTIIANDSYVDVDDIGVNETGLLCHTNKTTCCGNDMSQTRAGEWYYPNGSKVRTMGESSEEFFRNRDTQVVRLNNRQGEFTQRGRFQCKIPDEAGTMQTLYVKIVNVSVVTTSPSVAATPRTVGDNFTLMCQTDITPSPPLEDVTFEWFFGPDNSSLPSNVTVSDVTNTGNTYANTLQFSPILLSHVGMYVCRLWNYSTQTASTIITVNYSAIVGLENTTYTVMEGFKVEICFFAQGSLRNMAEVTISIEAVAAVGDVVPTNFTSQAVNVSMATKLCINISTNYDKNITNIDKQFNVTISSNTRAVAIDPAMATALITIQNIPPPDIVPMIMNLTLGKNATFRVSANFSENLKFQWLYNNTNVISGGRSSVLTVMNVTKEDGGIYNCIVSFPFGGNIASKEAQLFVFSPATIHKHPSDKAVAQGGTSNFSVNVSGDGLTYQWQRNGTNIPGNNRFEGVFDAVLTIKDAEVEDAGKYKCIVFNGAGDNVTSNEANLTVISQPSITNQSFESNFIALYWKQNDAVESYKIQYNFTIRQCANQMATQITNDELNKIMGRNNYTIHNGTRLPVEEDSNYTISLFAVKSDVSGPATIIVNTTKEAAPSGVPVSIRSTPSSSTSITITWDRVACDQRNGEIDGYNVTYYPEDKDTNEITNIVLGVTESNRTFLASGLQPLTNYTFEVQAFNRYGYGPVANATFQTPVSEGLEISNDSIFIVGENAVINCTTAIEVKELLWLDQQGNLLVNSSSDTMATLGFNPVNDSIYNKTFICRVIQTGMVDKHIKINVSAPFYSVVNATITHSLNKPIVGEPYNLTCLYNVSKGFTHKPSVLWKYPDGTNFSSSLMVFDALHVSDRGIYTCEVMLTSPVLNDPEIDKQTYDLTIQFPTPDVSISVPNTTLYAGSAMNLTCTATLTMEVDIDVMLNLTWFQGSTLGACDTTLISPPQNSFTKVLTLSPLNAIENNITCLAKIFPTENTSLFLKESSIESNSEILMVENPTINVTITPSSKDTQNVRNAFNITCAVLGLDSVEPVFAYQWTSHSNDSIAISSSENRSTILFPSLNFSDAGQYTCKVNVSSNYFTGGHEIGINTFNLSIRIPEPLSVTVRSLPQMIYAGFRFTLYCNITLNMEVKALRSIQVSVNWTGPVDIKMVVSDIDIQQLNENSLQYNTSVSSSNSSHTGNYTCTVQLRVSDSSYLYASLPKSAPTEIKIIQAPSPPNISLVPLNSTSVQVSWMKRNNIDEVDNVTVEYSYEGPCINCSDQDRCRSSSSITDTLVVFSNLQEYSQYSFTITAFNKAGPSSPTNISMKTYPATPSGSPESINITSNISSITIQWSHVDCIEQNSEITGYQIVIDQMPGVTYNVSSEMQQFITTKLFPNTMYELQLAAVSNNGTGPFKSIKGSTKSPDGVGLLLNGEDKKNNSMITWMGIGERNDSLFCLSNKEECCNTTTSSGWVFPNQSTVVTMPVNAHVYQRSRKNAILLQSQGGTPSVSGIFQCTVVDASNQSQHLYIGIYPQLRNNALLSLTFVPKNWTNFLLNCTSMGSPVNQMQWLHNNSSLQNSNPYPVLANAEIGLYYSTLLVNEQIMGLYQCRITDELGMKTNETSYEVKALNQPANAHAVWTDNGKFFHICWKSHDTTALQSPPSPSPEIYNITDISFSNLYHIDYNSSYSSYCANLTRPPAKAEHVFIQVSSETALPSKPLRVNISESGVKLMLQGKMIVNESALSIDMIGENDFALICRTTKMDCCRSMGTMQKNYGEWYYPGEGKRKVGIKSMMNEAFYRTRGVQEVLLQRRNSIKDPETGMFCCEVADSDDNCGINQTVCVSLGSLTFNTSENNVAGENYTLTCTARVPSMPTFIWSGPSGSINQTSYGITLNNAASISDSQYISSIEFTPLKASHEGKYTCKISSPDSSIYTEVTVNDPDITVQLSEGGNLMVGANHTFTVSINGAQNLNSVISYAWTQSYGTMRHRIGKNSSTFSLHSLRLSNAGMYTCMVTISSTYLGGDINKNPSANLSIEMPSPISISVKNTTNPDGGPLFIPKGNTTSISLICDITLSTLVDIPVKISYRWTGNNFSEDGVQSIEHDSTESNNTITVDALTLDKAGVYTCEVAVSSTNTFIIETGTSMSTTNVALYKIHITRTGDDNYLGNAISLNCTVEARGTHKQFNISWIYSLDPRANIEQNSTSLSQFLWFNSLRASHAGVYVCNASLAPMTGSEQTNITLPLYMNLSVFVNTSTPVRAGDSISIICSANTDRTLVDVPVDVDLHLASPKGRKETERFPNSNDHSFHQISMHFSDISAQVSGNFTCNATIRASSTNEFLIPTNGSVIFDLILVPSKPRIDTVQVTNNSIAIAWSQAMGDQIENYQISYDYQDRCTDHSYNSSRSSKQTNITLEKLEEFSNYQISITAMNSQGASSSIMNISTLSSAPSGEPQNVTGTTINSTSIRIQWKDVNCIKRNGEILAYNVAYRAVDYSQPSLSLRASPSVRSLVLNHLIPRTNYNLLVAAVNVNGTGPTREMTISTGDVEGVMLFHNGSFHPNNSIININEIGEGTIALFCFTNKLNCCDETLGLSGEWYFPNGSTVEKENNEGAIYRNRGPSVVCLNQKSTSSSLNGIFHCEIPLINGTNQSLYAGIYPRSRGKPKIQTFMFEANAQSLICISTDGPATYVTWKNNGVSLPTQGIMYTQVRQITNMTKSIYTNTLQIRGVDPSTVAGNYSCLVSNLRGYDEQNLEIKDIRVTGHESAIPFGAPAVQLNCTTDLAVNLIEWLDAQGRVLGNGTDSLLELTVIPSESLLYTCRIKGVFGNQTKNITLTVLPEASSVLSSAVPAIITVILLAVILLVLIATSMLVVRRKRQGKLIFPQRVKSKLHSTFVIHATPLDSDDEKLEMSTFGKFASVKHRGAVVPVEEFENHVKNMHNDRDQLFETEYASFRKDPQRSYAAADTMVNRLRNRFGNIFPYDHCRVKLKEIAGYEHSDYINASYMDGYQKPSAYIAAQGPLPNTLEDFWRMIWEKRLTTIVMLTQCFEGRKKCECYWPDNINVAFEPGQGIKVILTSMVPFSEYTIRKMTVTRTTEPQLQPLEVIQLHFIAWPDHGVPDNCAVMLNFIRRVRKLHPYSNPCPLLVHCSAGVGRTGTFIVLDTMLERMKAEDTLNVYDYVKHLREQRVLMVQTLAQYMFIHDALKEYILCGQTEIIASDIRNVIDNLSVQHDPCSAASGFDHQFQILGQLQYVTEENSYSNATSEQNIGKNRYSNKLPNNFYRVRLKSSAVPGSDYINASFIHGYRQKKTYIATQGPLESTVCDFWRMVWENESKCIVLLGQLKENNKEMCCCYWPTTEGHTQTYGQITVKFLTEERYGYCDLRKFEIDEEKAGVEGVKTAFTVTQFHFLEWPEHETPPITSSLIELMGNVNRVQMGAASKPMIVMCNDGVGRTGTFICIHAQLERLKTEGVFDFFQFIKSARIQRAGLVSDNVQYVLCHEVLADYLDSFDTYANFKEVM